MDDTRNSARRIQAAALHTGLDGARDIVGNDAEALPDDYDERPVESALELEELARLRAELTWADWKAHPRFKKDRVIREAQRRMGVAAGDAPVVPAEAPANDVVDHEAELARDADFATSCDERRDAWIEALDADESSR